MAQSLPVSLVLSIALALLAGEARAGATVDLLFVGVNGSAIGATDTVVASPGDTLEMAILMRNDEPLTSAFFSLSYDLDGDDELDVVSAFQWAGVLIGTTDDFGPLSGPNSVTATLVGSFQGVTSTLPVTLPAAGGASLLALALLGLALAKRPRRS